MKDTIKSLLQDIFTLETLEYMLVGVFTIVVDIGIYMICYKLLPIDFIILTSVSNAIAWIASTTFSLSANKMFVFKSRHTTRKHFWYEVGTWYGTRLFSLIISEVLLILMIDVGHWDSFVSKLIVNILVIISNWIFAKLLIFKRKAIIQEAIEDNEKDMKY